MNPLIRIARCLVLCVGLSAIPTLLTGCVGSNSRSTGQYIEDKTLAMRVSNALDDNPTYKFDDVKVKGYRDTVQLSGFVSTQDQKNKAGEIAKNVQGVQGVQNNITVKPYEGGNQ